MQPTTPTEPPDTRKNSELPKSRHFAAYSTLEHRPNPRAKSLSQKTYRVTGKKRKMLRAIQITSQGGLRQMGRDCAGALAFVSAGLRRKHSLCDLLRVCTWVHEQERSWRVGF